MNSSRKPWTPSSKSPGDLKRTDKYLYTARADPNQPIQDNSLNAYYSTIYGLPKKSFKPHLKTLEKSKSISQVQFIL